MESALLPAYELGNPRHRAVVVAGSIAVVEFVLLVALTAVVFGPRIEHALAGTPRPATAARTALRTTRAAVRPPVVHHRPTLVAPPLRPPRTLKILVLNGNGVAGAAGRAAAGLRRLGYRIAHVGNATRMDYPRSVVLYAPGYRAEGLRLARDLRVPVVGPLDGMHTQALDGGELAVILGG